MTPPEPIERSCFEAAFFVPERIEMRLFVEVSR